MYVKNAPVMIFLYCLRQNIINHIYICESSEISRKYQVILSIRHEIAYSFLLGIVKVSKAYGKS